MCLGIPGKVVEIRTEGAIRMGTVDFDGVTREVCLEYLPEAAVGQYVIVHVGFAISLLDESEARETLALLRQIEEAGAGDGAGETAGEGT